MNINQSQSCLTSIGELKKIDLANLIFKSYEGENDLNKIAFTKYTAAEFIKLFDKMLNQLDYELTSGLQLLLPNAENFNNDFSTIDISKHLPVFINYFDTGGFTNAETLLDRFIHYQIKNGFWNTSKIEVSKKEQSELNAQHKLISKNLESLNENMQMFENMRKDYNQVIESAENLVEEKNGELKQIVDKLTSADSNEKEVTRILAEVVNKNTEISGVLDNVKEKLSTVDTDIIAYQESFDSIVTESDDLDTKLNTSLDKATANFKLSEDNAQFVADRKEEIERLTGMAADGALGSKFHDREKKLTDKVPFWRTSIIVVTVLAIAWVVVVFTCLPAKFDNEWVNLGVNLLKTTPVFILLGFVFKQYGKERNLEEEYAFKSAVAMTLTAYSNMLSQGDRDDNDSKQKMLLASIENLYTQPKIHTERKGNMFSFNTKHLKETVESLNETLSKFEK